MIREIIVEFKEGDDSVRKRILDAITREIHEISLYHSPWIDNATGINFEKDKLPEFPGHVIINIFDENEQLMEIIET